MAQKIIEYGIRFNVEQSSLNNIRLQLKTLLTGIDNQLNIVNDQKEIAKLNHIKGSIQEVNQLFSQAFNSDLGVLNISKLNTGLKSLNLSKIAGDFSQLGAAGRNAFGDITAKILTTNTTLQKTNGFISNIATTLTSSLKWSLAYGAINEVGDSIRKSYDYVKSLDGSLNDIRIVTEKSADEMERFARSANKAAKEIGVSTKAYTDASLIYYQQGLGDAETQERARITSVASNITGQSTSEVSEQLTAIWNGYKVDAGEAELYIDKVAKVAAQTGADLEELATGMSKVASAANVMGVDVDQLNAQLATVITVTRQAPESVGTAFKTIYSRINAIEAGSEDAESSLKQYTEDMKAYGFSVLDANGKLRDTGEIIEEIGGKWQDLTKEQQVGLAQVMAGQRQYNNLLALFENWDMYTKSLNDSANAAGTLQKQQDIYMESTEAHMAQLQASSERLYSAIFDTDSINTLTDGLSEVVDFVANFMEAIGGGQNALLALGAIGMNVFSNQIGAGLAKTITNMQLLKQISAETLAKQEISSQFTGINTEDQYRDISTVLTETYNITTKLSEEQRDFVNETINGLNTAHKELNTYNEELKESQDLFNKLGTVTVAGDGDPKIKKLKNQKEVQGKGIQDFSTETTQELISSFNSSTEYTDQILADAFSGSSIDTLHSYTNELMVGKVEMSEIEEVSKNLAEQVSELTVQYERNKDSIQVTSQEYEVYKNAVKNSEAAQKELQNAINEYNNTKDGTKEREAALKRVEQAQKKVGQTTKKVEVSFKKMITSSNDSTKKLAKSFEKDLPSKIDTSKKAIDSLKERFNGFKKALSLETNLTNLTKGFSGLASAASALSSLSNLSDIWSDENLSAGEKFLQTIQNVGFAIPMLTSGITAIRGMGGAVASLAAGLNNWTTAQKVATLATEGNIAATKLLNMELTEENALKALSTIGIKAKNQADLAAIATKLGLNTVDANGNLLSKESLALSIAELIQKKLKNAATKEEIVLKLKELATEGLLNTAKGIGLAVQTAYNIALAIGKALLQDYSGLALLAAAGIIAVGATVAIATKKQEKENEAKKAAIEKTNQLNEATSSLKETISSTGEAFDKYKDALTTLKSCVRGTTEWDDALGNVESSIETLLEKLPSLRSALEWNDELGTYVLNEGIAEAELKALRSSEQAYTNAASSSKYRFEQDSIEDEVQDKKQRIRNLAINSRIAYKDFQNGNEYWDESVVNALYDIASSEVSEKEKKKQIEALASSSADGQIAEEELNKILEELEKLNQLEEESLNLDRTEAKEFALKNDKLIKDNLKNKNLSGDDLQFVTTAASMIAQKSQDKYQEDIKKIFNKGGSKELRAEYGLENLWEGQNVTGFEKSNSEGGKALDKLLDLTGEAFSRVTEEQWLALSKDEQDKLGGKRTNVVQGDDGDRTFLLYEKATGKIQKFTDDYVYEIAAANHALQQLGVSTQKAEKILKDLGNAPGGQALINLFSDNNLDNVLVENIKNLQAEAGETEADYIKYAEGLGKEVWESLGFSDAKSYGEYLYDKVAQFEEFSGDELSKTAKAAYDKLFGEEGLDDSLTAGQQQKLGNMFQEVFNVAGQEGLDALTSLFESVGDNKKLQSALANFDFSTGSIEELTEAIVKAGGKAEISASAISTLYKVYESQKEAVQVSAEAMAKASELVRGSTISADEYKNYEEFASEYFTKMHDGSYMLTQDADTFYSLVKEKRKGIFEDAITDSENKLKDLEDLSKIKNIKDFYSSGDGGENAKIALDAMVNAGYITTDRRAEFLVGMDSTDPEKRQKAYAEIFSLFQNFDIAAAIENENKALADNQEQLSTIAESREELNELVRQGKITEEQAATALNIIRSKELQAIGKSTQELNNYIALRKMEGVTAEALKVSKEEYIDLLTDEFIAKSKLQNAFGKIQDDFPDLYDTLLNQDSTAAEKASAAATLSETFKEAFGIQLSDDFFYGPEGVERLNLYKDAIEGDYEALQKLKKEATVKIITEDPDLDGIETQLLDFIDWMAENPIEIGSEVKYSGLTEIFNHLITQAGWTVSQIESLFRNMQLDVKVKSQTISGNKNVAGRKAFLEQQGYTVVTKSLGGNDWELTYFKTTASSTPPSYDPTKDDKDDKTPDELELFDPEIDEYRDINNELEKFSREREKLSKKSEHLTGEALIQNLEEQNRLLEKQNKKIQEKIGLLKKEANTIKNDLSKGIQVGKQNIEVTFDEEGNITNFTSALIKAKEAVNALELEYNAARTIATEAELEALREQIEKAKEMYEMLAELMERYDEILYSEIPDMEDQFDENLDQIIENNIKKFNVKIEIELDAFDLETKFRDLQRKIKYDEDNPFDLSEIAEDKIGQLEASSDLISKLTDHVNSLMGNRGVYGDHTQEYLDDLKKYTEELMSNLEDVEELIDEIKAHFIELLESAQEAFDDQIANYEALAAQLEHDIALLDLLNGEERNFAAKQAYYDKQAENYKSQLAFQKQTISFWQEQLSLAEEGTEAYNVAKENLLAGIEDLNSTLEEAIENAQEAHINSIKAIFEELENQVTGGKGLSFLETEWEHIKDLSDDYYDSVNRAYELSKLEANYQKALEETDSVSAQNMINAAMQQELEMLKQKEKLSKYDIDRANLKYQLTMKQIALEDAQKNKSTMRLKRDANGNYSYQYVADQSGISEIEQQIADLNNQIHNLDVQEYNRTLDDMLQYWREYQEAMIEAAQINDPEERAKVEEEIKKFYSEKFTNIERDNQNVRKNLNENATQYIKDLYGGLGDYQVNDLLPTIVAGWDGSVQQMIDFISGEGGFEQVCLDSWAKIDEATKTYQQTVDDLAASAGVDLDDIRLGIDDLLPSLQGIIDKNDDIIDKYGEEISAMRAVMGVLDDFISRYNSVRAAAMSAAEAAVSSYRTIANAASANNSTYDSNTNWAYEASKEFVIGNHWEDELGHRGTKIEETGNSYGVDNARLKRLFDAAQKGDERAIDLIKRVEAGQAFFTHETLSAINFNTGGYTGSWANGDTDGKLAFLHQKELILNRADTANLLQAVDILRSLDANLLGRIAGMVAELAGVRFTGQTERSDSLEQNVHIDAHFPNVSAANEIQEAFNQLINDIGQKMYQNKK